MLHFFCYQIRFQLFVLSFHQLSVPCNQLVTSWIKKLKKAASAHATQVIIYFFTITMAISQNKTNQPLRPSVSFLVTAEVTHWAQNVPCHTTWGNKECAQWNRKTELSSHLSAFYMGAGPLSGPLGTSQTKHREVTAKYLTRHLLSCVGNEVIWERAEMLESFGIIILVLE